LKSLQLEVSLPSKSTLGYCSDHLFWTDLLMSEKVWHTGVYTQREMCVPKIL